VVFTLLFMGLRRFHKENKEGILNGIGIVFLFWGVVAVINSIYLGNYDQIIWFCYIGLVLLGVGILMRNSWLVGIQLAVLGIPLLVWDIDFVYFLFTWEPLFGITDYMFNANRELISNLISLQHIFTLPLGIYALYLIKGGRSDFWKGALVEIVAVYLSSLLVGKSSNVNCVYESCVNFGIGLPYGVEWFIGFLLMIFIVNGIFYFLEKKFRFVSGG
jgi:hypothetical protein